MLEPKRFQCGGRLYNKWEAVPKNGSVVSKGCLQMMFANEFLTC